MTPQEATALLEPPAGGTLDLDEARAEYRATLGTAIDEARAKVLQAEELLVAVEGAIARLSAHLLGLEKEASQIDLMLRNGHQPEPTVGGEHDTEAAPGVHVCELCDRTFPSLNGLKIHQGRQHRMPMPPPSEPAIEVVETIEQHVRGYHCTDCPVGFERLSDMKAHTHAEHDRGPTPSERTERIVPEHARHVDVA